MRDVKNIVILTGAGISAESGITTLRGPGGLWEGHHVEDLCTPEALARDRHLVHRFYKARRAALANGPERGSMRRILPPGDSDAAFDPGLAQAVGHLRVFAKRSDDRPVRILFDFFARPLRIEGERVVVMRTQMDAAGAVTDTGESYVLPASLVVSCIG